MVKAMRIFSRAEALMRVQDCLPVLKDGGDSDKIYRLRLPEARGNEASMPVGTRVCLFVERLLKDWNIEPSSVGTSFEELQKMSHQFCIADAKRVWQGIRLMEPTEAGRLCRTLAFHLEIYKLNPESIGTTTTDMDAVIRKGAIMNGQLWIQSVRKKTKHWGTEHLDLDMARMNFERENITLEDIGSSEEEFEKFQKLKEAYSLFCRANTWQSGVGQSAIWKILGLLEECGEEPERIGTTIAELDRLLSKLPRG
jgi:hypothetical protein